MSKKQDSKGSKKIEVELSAEESMELDMILDRLSVQDPEGESLENCLRTLRETLVGRERLVAGLLERLGRNPTKVGFRAFLMLDDLVESKKYRRAVKQAGYRFGQRGFTADEGAPSEERVVLIPKEERKVLAHMAPSVEAFWFLSALIPESGYPAPVALTAFAEDGFQRINVKVAESSYRAYRDFYQKIASHFPFKVAEIPAWHAARIFEELVEFCENRGVFSDIEHGRQLLKPYHDPQKAPYAYELMPAVEDPERELHNVDMHGLLPVSASMWLLFSREEVLPYRERIAELERPVLVVPREIQEQRTLDVLKKAVGELCVGRARFLYQRYFEELAMWLELAARKELAMSAWIVAQHLRVAPDVSENPAVLQMVLKSMQQYWPDDFKKEETEAGPYEETGSGLIIPR